jgi:subtilisin family serine protease
VTVAIIDTGIDSTHPDLEGALVDEACFATSASGQPACPNGKAQQFGEGSAKDDNGHGTHIAGIIAGRGRTAPLGLAPNAKLVAIKVADADGSTSASAMIAALNYILKTRPDVQVVNMSLGTFATYKGVCDAASPITAALLKAGQALRSRGVVIVAAAGNEGLPDRISAPACVTGFLSVGAVYSEKGAISANGCTDLKTVADRVACFSNSSARLDLLAPGAGIVSADLGGGKANRSGTSQAAAVVTGAVALLLEGAPESGNRIGAALTGTGASITDMRNGRVTPRLDTRAALTALNH